MAVGTTGELQQGVHVSVGGDGGDGRVTRLLARPPIPTALTKNESRILYGLALDRTVLEFGSLLGYSTIIMAQSAEHVFAVDPHEGYPKDDPKPTLTAFLENISRYGVKDRVTPIVTTGQNAFKILKRDAFDLVFIDITRSAEELIWLAHELNPAVIAIHDYGIEKWDGATKAVTQYSKDTGKKFKLIDTLAVFE